MDRSGSILLPFRRLEAAATYDSEPQIQALTKH